jgi:hypothetical protein
MILSLSCDACAGQHGLALRGDATNAARSLSPPGTELVNTRELSVVMLAKAGIQYPVRQMAEPKPCSISNGGGYWIIHLRG